MTQLIKKDFLEHTEIENSRKMIAGVLEDIVVL